MARVMKDSGIEWIGEIPACWELRPARYAFSEVKEKNVEGLETRALQFKFGKIIAKTNFNAEDDDYVAETITNYTIVEPGTVMINGLNLNYDFKTQRAALVTERGVITSAYLALRPDEQLISPEYATYLFKGYESKMALHNMGAGIRLTLGYREFKNQPVLFPPLGEQQRIVDFLDSKCAEIDALTEKTKATIEEYKKLKQSVITEAVTKGIRGNRPMKDSGIEWIGEIPEEWTRNSIKNVAETCSGGTPPSNDESMYDGEINWICSYDLHEKAIVESGRKITEAGANSIAGKLQQSGSVLIAMYGGAGTIGNSGILECEARTNQAICSIKFNNDYVVDYYGFYYIIAIRKHWMMYAVGTRKDPNISQDIVKRMPCVIPPIDEQREIIAYLDEKCSALDTLIAKKTALLTELETYKKSLIYEYVTGKKECLEGIAHVAAANEYPYFPATVNARNSRFAQAVLMSKILDIHGKGIGRVKLEKMLYTIETSIGFDFDTEYVREIAGPLHESVYKCEGIISRKNKWYQLHKSQYGVSYIPTKNVEGYRSYYDRYFSAYNAEVERIINIFKPYSTDQAEVVATLFAAWNDAIIEGKPFTDESIVDDVLNNWHDNKKRFAKEVWLRAMAQMKQNNIVPKGYGKRTVLKKECNS